MIILGEAVQGAGLRLFLEHLGEGLLVAGVVILWIGLRWKKDPGKIERSEHTKVLPKTGRFSMFMCEEKHSTIDRRLKSHDEQLQNLWQTMREEDEKTRQMLNRTFQEVERSLGRIEGKLDSKL
jgi:hypothetical protein